MKIKVFLKWFLSILIMQIVIWGSFVIINEFISDSIADVNLIASILIPIASTIIYFMVENKFVKSFGISRLKFTSFALILWNIINYLIAVQVDDLVFRGILSKCDGSGWACGFNGLEYIVFMFAVAIASAIILVCEVIYWIYKTKKNKKEN